MAITSVGNGSDSGTQLADTLTKQLAERIPSGGGGHGSTGAANAKSASGAATGAAPAPGLAPGNVTAPVAASGATGLQLVQPKQDVAVTLWQQVASSDLAKLNQILQPPETPQTVQVLDTLLKHAIEQVNSGNEGRAVGYLADFATRAPGRAELLVSLPELEPVRAQMDTLLGRMTAVAKMTAEDGLVRAGQSAEDLATKIPTWDTKPEVLVQLAHRLYEAGGYANYSRTSELTRALTTAADPATMHALAGATSGAGGLHNMQTGLAVQSGAAAGVMVPGITIPYVVSPFTPQGLSIANLPKDADEELRRAKLAAKESARESWEDIKEIVRETIGQLWNRAPLLVLMIIWLCMGIAGGIAVSVLRQLSPDSPLVAISDPGFQIWGLGFLALVGLGFWARVRGQR
jgi:hypothetical protein